MGLLGGPWEPFFAVEAAATTTTSQVPTTTEETSNKAANDDNDEYYYCNDYNNGDTTTTETQKQQAPSSVHNLKYLLGLFLIFLQCIIQVGNAVLTQVMFEKMNVDSPILLTYVGISLLAVLLPIELWKDYTTYHKQQQEQEQQAGIDNAHSFDSLAEDIRRISSANSFSTYNGQLLFMNIAKRRADELVTNHSRQWNHRKHILAACLLMPAMFLSDWLFNASLQTTSVSSATVLVSIQSVFVFCIAASVFKMESATIMKLLGVLCGVVGTVLTALHDETNADDNDPDCYTEEDTVLVGDSVATTTKGDILAVAAAAFYALYTIQVRLYCPQNEDLYSLPLLLGYIGLVSLLVTFPIVALTTAKETIVNLTATSIGVMLLKGLFDFLISDYLMFRSIVLTSPTVASKYSTISIVSIIIIVYVLKH